MDVFMITETNYKPKEGSDVRVFESGAKRDGNQKKPFIHLISGYFRQRVGYLFTKGAVKYGAGNYLRGIPTEVYLESIDRHLASYMEGNRDEDHIAAIVFGCNGIMLNEQKEGIKADHYFNL